MDAPSGLDEFRRRHIGPDVRDRDAMLEALGADSIAELIRRVVPPTIARDQALELPPARTEQEVIAELRRLASRNAVYRSFIGMGYYGTFTPAVIARNVLENPAWYTAYTPYQPEISQGRLEALLNFQTMICDLTGLPIANASLLDEATAAAEAMALCLRNTRQPNRALFVSDGCHPQTIAVVRTRAECLGVRVIVGSDAAALSEPAFAVLLQYPQSTGAIVDYSALVEAAHAQQALVAMVADPLALTLLTPPGEFGVDVVVGSSQRFGVPMGYGGPHAAYLACRDEFKRTMPGRLVGVSVDSHGTPAYRLALQTREQHIRREKATSNICTAQVLLAVIASMYAVYHGPQGLVEIATRVHRRTTVLAAGLRRLGFSAPMTDFFDTIAVPTGERTAPIFARAAAARMNLRRIGADTLGISLDETTSERDIEELWDVFANEPMNCTYSELAADVSIALPASLRRRSPFLRHPVFVRYRSETEMMRYLRSLADKDLALDRTMIPLGSCTMKLNAATEMVPITWPEFAAIHPFAPFEQAEGYLELIATLEKWLCAITGFDAVSLQPNSGAQGEFAGLLAIRAYHRQRGEGRRTIVLIPESAHGTNPASAQMAGFDVVVVKCDAGGNVDLADLRGQVQRHADRLAALMVTYPSTHGVFEETIGEICALVHECGGQVYLDGANLNALVGIAAPGEFGADVSHLNLHKTFCIPHGGGGPGVGPVAVRAHLAPYLPGKAVIDSASAVGPVSAAPFGSAGILPISWAYIALMGGAGLTEATQTAILSANYIAHRLGPHYPVLYTGRSGLVAHECIIDLRPLKECTAITVEDVAKRLIDYGFHAPTMSFPVAGTLMIEPTESESKAEIDRFCDAMIAIRHEIAAVEDGRWNAADSPLRRAPHTAESLLAQSWAHPYSREQAAYPVASLRRSKYWPPVGRIDNAYGDRNLFCSCPPVEAFEAVDEPAIAAAHR